MTKIVRLTFSVFIILLLISLSLANVGTVLADEGTPTDVPTSEPTDPPAEETSEPVATLPPEAEPATPAPEESTVELLAQVPENTDVVVLDESGETVSLATQTAADIVEQGDPMWCPAGQAPTPGANGCTTNYTSITQLIAELTGSNIDDYQQDGIIYFAAGSSGGSFTLTAGSIGGGDFGTLNDYNLTLQGGWDPITGDLNGQTNFGTSTIAIGSNGNTWNGTVTINNMTFNNVTGTSLTVFTSGDDITLNNVDVTYTTPATNQNNQYNVILDTSAGGSSGDITIGAGSSFDNGANGAGLFADADSGDITITGEAGAPITFTDANGSGTGTNYNGATLAGDTVTLTNVTATNNDLNGIFIDNPDVVVLNNVNASNNGTDPSGQGINNAVGSGVNIDGGGGADTVVVVNGGTFSDNERYGVQVSNSSIIVENAPTCSGNNFAATGTNNCFSEAPVTDSTAPNTTLKSGPSGTVSSTTAAFTFSGTDNLTPSDALSFECSLDGAGFSACASPTSYSGLASGSHTFRVRAVDLAGNVDLSPASRTWTVDSIGPTVTINLPAPNGSNGWFTSSPVNGTVTATDNVMITNLTCSGLGVSQGGLAGDNTTNASRSISVSGGGTHTVTCTATDSVNNNSQSTVTVKIDTTAPIITPLGTSPDPNGSGWNNSNVTVTWACLDMGSGHSGSGSWFVSQDLTTDGANQSVTGTCQNDAGLSASDTETGINIDKTAPVISGSRTPANVNGWNNSSVVVSFTCSDALAGANINTVAGATLSAEGAGQSVTNTGTCTDRAGNTASPATVGDINIDRTAPTASATAAPAPNGNGWNNTSVTVTFSGSDALSGIDFCDAPVVLSSQAAAQSASGTCTDRAGNISASATASNINIDTAAPTLTLPADLNIEAASTAGATVSYSASATDNLDNSIVVSCSPASGSTFPLGTTTVTCSSTDQADNTATDSFTVTVGDTTAPALSLPANIIQEAVGPAGNAVTFTATATDVVDGPVAVSCTPASGSTFALGTTTVNCSATDAASNTASGSFTVTIRDTRPPKLTLPANITQEAVGPTGNVVTFVASAKDAVDGAVAVNCTPASGSIFALGTTTVNCSSTDAANNTATGTFTVTIRDTTAPALALPADIIEEALSPAGNVVTFTATSSDVVDGSVPVTCTPASGSTFGLTTTTVNCSATDQAGNTASGSFTVTVRDTTAPALTLPSDIVEEAVGPAGNVVTFTATSSDVVDGPVAVTCTPASGSTFAITTTTVTCSATDTAGNSASDSFTVTVRDTTAPTLSLPADISEEALGPAGNVVTFTVTATDVVDGSLPVTCTPASGSTFGLGTTVVTCSATDTAENTATETFTVTIGDATAPRLTLPADITQEAVGPAGNAVTFIATALDTVDGSVFVTCTPASGSTFAIMTTTVTCSATDAAENTATGTFTITVQDTTGPVIASHGDLSVKASSNAGEDVHYASPSTTDLVDGAGQATCSPASGSIFPVGDTVVTCTAVDAHGNAAAPTTFTVHVFEETETHGEGGADLFIPHTGSSNFAIACQAPDSFVVETQGARIIFSNLCGYDALVEGLESASLPGKLPSGASFLGGFTIDVLKDGKSVSPLPKDSSITLEFDLAGDFDVEDYSALVWNGTTWVEVTGEKTADGYFRITLTDGGTFIIVEK